MTAQQGKCGVGLVFKRDPVRGVCIKRVKQGSPAQKYADILLNSAVVSLQGALQS
jgi:hypothetical protein